jgi:hypothetical protein
MANYLVTVPEVAGTTIVNGVKNALVVAENATIAKLLAGGLESGSPALWNSASATALVAASGWAGWGARVRIQDGEGANVVDVSVTTPAAYSVASISAGSNKGHGYSASDSLFITGAAGDTPAKVDIDTVAVGAVATLTKTTNGSYTVDPAGSGVATAGGTGTGLTVNLGSSGGGGPYTLGTVALGAAHGTGYVAGDVVNVPATGGGTPGTITINTVDGLVGAVLTFTLNAGELGSYAATPVASNKATTTDGAGSACTITVATAQGGASGDIDELGIALAHALQALGNIAHAAFDQSSNILTVAGTSDNLGDHTLLVDMIAPGGGGAVNSVLGAIVDEGSAGDALTVQLPADNYDIPAIIGRLKGA